MRRRFWFCTEIAASVVLLLFIAAMAANAAAEPTPGSGALHVAATPSPARSPALFEATSRHSFADVEHWQATFDDPARDSWQRPREVVAALAIEPGMVVADLGAGTGYFLPYLATAVGPAGVVLAVETEPKMVEHLRRRAEQEGLANVIPVLASADNPRLPTGRVDIVAIVDTFHHVDARLEYFQRLRRALTARGRVVVIDWHKRELPVGPAPDHKLSREQVIEEMAAAGYVLTADHDLLPYQYFLAFRMR